MPSWCWIVLVMYGFTVAITTFVIFLFWMVLICGNELLVCFKSIKRWINGNKTTEYAPPELVLSLRDLLNLPGPTLFERAFNCVQSSKTFRGLPFIFHQSLHRSSHEIISFTTTVTLEKFNQTKCWANALMPHAETSCLSPKVFNAELHQFHSQTTHLIHSTCFQVAYRTLFR